MRVCVIGAGVVGVTSAYFLARQGHDVVLVDSQARPAEVSSYANGGQLSYSYVAPLAGPGVLPSVPGWLLREDSPLRFRPRLDPHQWRWCLQFALACRASVAKASTVQLAGLSYLSRDVMHSLLEQEDLDFGHLKNGKLIAYRSPALLDKARALDAG
ncbi:D-amino acid dehydrogenase small subunit, partial [Achromobacter xylosoxidans]